MRAVPVLLVLSACTGRLSDPDALPLDEEEARDELHATPITLTGEVLDPSGAPVPGATVVAGDVVTVTGSDGGFVVTDLPRHNVVVTVQGSGWRPEVRAAWLYREVEVDEAVLAPVVLQPEEAGSVRFVFGGDVALGRRYLDPDESTPWTKIPPDDPTALIQASDPLPGTRSVLAGLVPIFDTADVPVVNLESVVTDRPDTPHQTKDYVYFTLPGSLPALVEAGVEVVSLGNNHTYDYLEAGVVDTMANVDASGLGWAGLGRDPDEAWTPWRADYGGTPYSFVSASSIAGEQYDVGFLANEDQGGAADVRDSDHLDATFGGERDAGRVPLALFHMGEEYTRHPNDYALSRMERAVDAGAALVVAHHPHFGQGFGLHEGVPMAYCLGNLAFDQDRLETMSGVVVTADLVGDEVRDLRGMMVELDGYKPGLVTGALADVGLRRIAEFSDATVAPWGERVHVGVDRVAVDREITVPVDVPADGWTVIDLRPLLAPGESVAEVRGPGTIRPGRDLMWHGDMEDLDVDAEGMEVSHWDVSPGSVFPCLIGAKRGAVGLCSTRSPFDHSDSVLPFRNRVRVWGDAENEPEKDLTFFGWVKGHDAGALSVVARYYASVGAAEFGNEVAWEHEGGTFDWRTFIGDVHMPVDLPNGGRETNPRAVRVFLRQSPPVGQPGMDPETGGLVFWDDLAVISWEETLDTADAMLSTPHARDFLRLEAPAGSHSVTLVLRRWEPVPRAF